MIERVARELDLWIQSESETRAHNGARELGSCTIRIVGQTALLEAGIGFAIFATAGVDAYVSSEYEVRCKFDELLNAMGRYLDPGSDKVWMPEETEYRAIFQGLHVELLLAEPDYVILSKALKAPKKNRALIVEYIARGPSSRFLELAEKYNLELEGVI